ncbi:hypothetical protein Dsin_002069 [Dipteronia sinensis]|uniref:Uncharacterized protein n=1 Tax=Dipteronia sinensis TaxID=43782 RepID=A0AAE0B553_9ROSI|nr:hypothetical protein Dsin_002069 [Dipteronia sinensis]
MANKKIPAGRNEKKNAGETLGSVKAQFDDKPFFEAAEVVLLEDPACQAATVTVDPMIEAGKQQDTSISSDVVAEGSIRANSSDEESGLPSEEMVDPSFGL